MKYKVGDYVRIRQDISPNECRNYIRINKTMSEYAGEITKVVSIGLLGYHLKNDVTWIWDEDMLEPVKNHGDMLSIASEIAGKSIVIKN